MHGKRAQATVMAADAVAVKPLSPLQLNTRVPLSVATVENESYGFAAIAGWNSARKISAPL